MSSALRIYASKINGVKMPHAMKRKYVLKKVDNGSAKKIKLNFKTESS